MHVLVVEDEAAIRDTLVDLLTDEGFVTSNAADGAIALAQLETGPRPDLILLDLRMRNLDAFGFREAQLARPALAGIPVMVMSGDNDVAEHAGRLNAAAWMRKPVQLQALVDTVRGILEAGGAPDSTRSGRMLILAVERDPHIRELEAHFLGQAGYAVEFATDGRAALAQAQALKPEIVITEILVPQLDGLALCRALKNDPRTKQIAVLVFSILAASSRAREAGADAFLMKPLAEHRLVGTVEALLAQRRGLQPQEQK